MSLPQPTAAEPGDPGDPSPSTTDPSVATRNTFQDDFADGPPAPADDHGTAHEVPIRPSGTAN